MMNSQTTDKMSLTRRTFMKITGAASSLLALSGCASQPLTNTATRATTSNSDEKVVWSACTVNCGSRCPLRMHVKDGEIKWVETDNTGKDDFDAQDVQVRACLRGRSMRRRIYSPDRLKYPLKRIGARGEGKFKRISWDEALDEIASNLTRITKEHGNESVYLNYGTGTLGGTVTKSWPQGKSLIARLMNLTGGYLNHYGDYSTAQIAKGLSYTYGGWAFGNSFSDLVNAKLVVQFGNNPAETRMCGGGLVHHYAESLARSEAKVIMVDPRHNDSVAGREDLWVPVRPGTDTALISAIAYELITNNWVDQAFLDQYCVGYDSKTLPASAPKNSDYKSYILGKGDDKLAKTPKWASKICGVAEDQIKDLARQIGTIKPCAILQGWGLQRTANGEMASRAVSMLAILTGNVGINGGGSGARESDFNIPFERFPTLSNPVKASISMFLWTDAIVRGTEMTAKADGVRGVDKLDTNIKFIWNYAGNCLINQHSDTNRTHEILQDDQACEMIVVIDNHMTSSAKYADIVLPDLTIAEQSDLCMDVKASNMPYFIFADKVIEPQFEARGIYDICAELAKRLGVEQAFTEGRTQEQWIKHLYELNRAKSPQFPDFDTMRQQGIYKEPKRDHFVAYKAFRDDPVNNPLKTPSGKIEIYSEQLATLAKEWDLPEGDVIHPLPIHVSTFEGHDSPERKDYPLQLVGFHYKSRVHSTYGSVDVLKAAAPDMLWMNPMDASARGIEHGQRVRMFNGRGEVHVEVKVTPRIMPNVVALSQGAWYSPDGQRIDQGACINTLTTQRPSPLAKGNPQHTNLVEVQAIKA